MTSTSYESLSPTSIDSLATESIIDLLRPIVIPPRSRQSRFTNWGLTFTCVPLSIFEPETIDQCALVLELARRDGRRLRFAGIGHSPSDLACTSEYMLRTTKLNKVLEVDTEKCVVVAQGGIILSDLHACLEKHGLAMSNLGSISDQSLAGVVSTATHGTGLTFGVLSTMVIELELMLADKSIVTCSNTKRTELFKASLCGLGSTGLILSIKMQVEPAFLLKDEQDTIDFDSFIDDFDHLVSSGEHTRFWWFIQNDLVRTSVLNRTREKRKPAGSWLWNNFFGYHVVQFLLFLGRFWLSVNTWTGLFAEWLIRGKTVSVDDSHKVFNVDCRYPQYTIEWAIPLSSAPKCLVRLRDWVRKEYSDPNGIRPHFPIEIRFTEADDIWLSPGYGQRMCWIGLIQFKPYGLNVPYRRFFTEFERISVELQGKPHWAKTHSLTPAELSLMYPKFPEFVKVLESVDPAGLFRNEYVRRHIFGETGGDVHGRIYKRRA